MSCEGFLTHINGILKKINIRETQFFAPTHMSMSHEQCSIINLQ